MIEEHLPVLQVVLPLLAGPVCLLLRRAQANWALATAVSWISFAIALALLLKVQAEDVIVYQLGGWAAPCGIEYRIDHVNAFVLLIVSGISSVVLLFAHDSVRREINNKRIYIFYTGWLLCLTGLLGMTATGDAFNVFVFLEISSLATYLLISLHPDRRALSAAFRYLVLGTIGATFILIGIALLYVMTGTLNIFDLADRLAPAAHTRTVAVAFSFLVIGIGIKAAAFPLHLWLPNAYAYAPSAVTALLAGTATKVAIYLLLRFLFSLFGPALSFEQYEADRILLPLAVVGIFSMSAAAIYQPTVKKLLAYSSVAQIGYMLLGISLASVTGLTATVLHLFNHALIKTALFMAMGCVAYRIGTTRLSDMAGLGRSMPWTMAAFVAGGLSLIGVPLTVGFISKWYLILAALEQGWLWLAAMIVLTSLMAVAYVWRVVEVAYFRDRGQAAQATEAPLSLLIPTWLMIAANFYFGVDASVTTEVAATAARLLFGAAT